MMNDLLREIEQYAEQYHVPIIEKDAADVLYNSVKEARPNKILEIGTAIGYSGLLMLSASSDNCTLTTVDIDTQRLELAEKNFEKGGVSDRVTVIEEDANYLITLLQGSYDYIFLDGPKAHYQTMLPYLLDLLNSNGILFVDDVGYHGWVDDGTYPKHKHRTIITNMRSFLKCVEENANIKSKRIDAGQGVLIIEKC